MVSIIIPVYNVEKYITLCVKSCIEQTYKNFEIIIIDDCSTDNSISIVNELLKTSDCSYKIVKKEKRLGVSNSRNIGISYALGEYILFLDADDYLKPNALECLINIANNGEYNVVYGNYSRNEKDIMLEEKANSYRIYNISYDDLGHLVWAGTIWGGIIKKDIIINNSIFFDESLEYGEDTIFKIELFNYIDKLPVADEILYYWRIVENSLSSKCSPSKMIEKEFNMLNVLNQILYKCEKKNCISIVIRMIRMKKNVICRLIFNSNDNDLKFEFKKVKNIKIPLKMIGISDLSKKRKLLEYMFNIFRFLENYKIYNVFINKI